MRTVCIDAGNSSIKIAFLENSAILTSVAFAHDDKAGLEEYLKSLPQIDGSILAAVRNVEATIVEAIKQKSDLFINLSADTPVPVHNLYKTPETLGKDRLAAVVGAYSMFPGKDVLIFDAGTALTIDFLDRNGNFRGGNISPGLNMRFKALHEYTEKIFFCEQSDDYQLIGENSSSAIVSGVQFGMIFEVKNYIDIFVKKYPELVVILTGGDMNFFVNKFETRIFAEPNLVFIGLDKIIKYNC